MIYSNKLSRDRMDELDRLFQEELAALERAKRREETPTDETPTVRQEFEGLRRRHRWTVSDVLGFFPHEESVSYLASLITQPSGLPETAPIHGKSRGEGV